jgi:hypothetical protein
VIQVAKRARRIIAFAMAFAMLSVPVAEAAGYCSGSCHTAGRYKSGGESRVAGLHSREIHRHTLSPSSLLEPVSETPSGPPADWAAGCKAAIGSATCAMTSLHPFVALPGANPAVGRGHRLHTASAYPPGLEMKPAQRVNGPLEAAHTAIARAAPTPLFLKNLSLLI